MEIKGCLHHQDERWACEVLLAVVWASAFVTSLCIGMAWYLQRIGACSDAIQHIIVCLGIVLGQIVSTIAT